MHGHKVGRGAVQSAGKLKWHVSKIGAKNFNFTDYAGGIQQYAKGIARDNPPKAAPDGLEAEFGRTKKRHCQQACRVVYLAASGRKDSSPRSRA